MISCPTALFTPFPQRRKVYAYFKTRLKDKFFIKSTLVLLGGKIIMHISVTIAPRLDILNE